MMMGKSAVILNTSASERVFAANLLHLKRRWRLHDWAVRALHGLLILSLFMSSFAVALPTSAAAPPSLDIPQSRDDGDNNYTPPGFSHPEPRVAERPLDPDRTVKMSLEPSSESSVAENAIPSISIPDPTQPPPGEPFAVLESHAEFAHPWIQVTEFSTNCPTGMEPTERFGICNATFTFYNGSGFTISEFGGYDLRVGYIDDYWRGQSVTYYTSVTDICRVGTFNRVESCIHQPVWQNEIFKAQKYRFPIGSHESIEMSKTIFWSLDPDVWWIDPSSSDASCTAKENVTDDRECPWCNPAKAQGYSSDPINSLTGTLDYQARDLTVSTPSGPLSFSRCYASSNPEVGSLGYGWVHNHDSNLTFPSDPDGQDGVVWFQAHCANRYAFIDNEDGTYSSAPGVSGTMIKNIGPPVSYTIENELGAVYTFNEEGQLLEWADADGRTWSYTYDVSDRLERVTDDASGRYLAYSFDGSDRVNGVADYTGRGVSFTYDGAGDLFTFTDVMGESWSYTYDADHHLAEVIDPRGITEVRTEYDADGRAVRQYNGEDELQVELTFNGDGTTNLTDGLGHAVVHGYDSTNALVSITDALGGVTATTYGTHFKPSEITDPLGHLTQMTWSAEGADLLQVIDAAGSDTDFTYDVDHHLVEIIDTRGFLSSFSYAGNLLTSATDALGGTTSYTHTLEGYLETATDALGRVTTFSYDGVGQPISMTDALGNTWLYSYDALGRLTDVTDPLGRVTQPVYDNAGRILQLTQNYNPSKVQNEDDEWNIITTYGYDVVGNLLTVTDTYGRVTSFSYDDANRLIEIHDAQGNTTTNVYDIAGNLLSITDALGHTSSNTYDANNRLHSVTDSEGNTFTLAYNLDDTIASSTDALGRTTTYTFDDPGRLTSTTDPLGNSTTFSYDSAGNLNAVTDALGHAASYEYDALNRLVQDTDALGGVTEHFYNVVGNRIQTINARGNATTYAYDNLDRLNTITDPLGHTTAFAYDTVGNLLSSTDPLGNITAFTYDGLNRRTQVVDPLSYLSALGYDAVGNLTSLVDANGVETRYEYDNLAHLTAVVENYLDGVLPSFQDNVRTEFTFNAVGNLIAHQDALGNVSSYTYDAVDRLISATDPLGNMTTFGYDGVGNRTSRTDALGFLTSFTYDAGDQLVSIDYPAADADVTYSYDAVSNVVGMVDGFGSTSWDYDALNRITAVIDPFGTAIGYSYDAVGNRLGLSYAGKATNYFYDAANRLTQVTDWAAGVTDYGYDAADQLSSATLPNGVTTAYGYDAAGQLTALEHQLGSATLAEYTYSYDPAGNLTQADESLMEARYWAYLPLILNDVSGEPEVLEGQPDEVDLLSTATFTPTPTPTGTASPTLPIWTATATPTANASATATSTPTSTLTPTLSATLSPTATETPTKTSSAGSVSDHAAVLTSGGGLAARMIPPGITSSSTILPVNAIISRTITYTYDPLSRLIAADYSSGEFFHYLYDAVGNRTELDTLEGETDYSYDAANRLTAVDGTPFTWDANGNLLADERWSYGYDHAGRLVGVTDGSSTYAFGYNGLGDRIWQEADGVVNEFTLDTNGSLAQVLYDGSTDYLYGLGRVGESQPGEWLYHLPDALGSVRQGVDANGRVTLSRNFTPFGSVLDEINPQDSPFGFTGEWTDPTDLVFLRARYYQPGQGRFTSRDPFSGFPIAPATLHPYLYAANNPLRYTDPSGEVLPFLAIVALAALAGGGAAALFEYGSQIHHNMKNCGMGFWDGANLRNHDASRLGRAFLEGFVMGGLGALTGGLIHWAGLTGLAAFAVGGIIDVQVGMIWDMAVRGYTPSEAFLGNVISFGIGEAIGFGLRGLFRGLGRVGGSAYDANIRPEVRGPDASLEVGRGNVYTVAHELMLPDEYVVVKSRGTHDRVSNQLLSEALASDPNFAEGMESLIPGIREQIQIGGPRYARPPEGWSWHHHVDVGKMQLVPTIQHRSSLLSSLFHPGGEGGWAIWGRAR
jgi:RHS repeat-associated protein